MGTTETFGLPYPDVTSSVDIPRDIRALAEAVDTLLAARRPGFAMRAFGHSFAGTAYIADPVLRVPVTPGRTYQLEAAIVTFGANPADVVMTWGIPADAILDWGIHTLHTNAAAIDGPAYQVWRGQYPAGVVPGLFLGVGAGGDSKVNSTLTFVSGRLRTFASAGDIQALFCQTTLGPTSWVIEGSWMRLTDVATY